MKTNIPTIVLLALMALSLGVDLFQQQEIQSFSEDAAQEQTEQQTYAKADPGYPSWLVKVVWQKQSQLGGGALPNMDDKDTDADYVIVKAKSNPDSALVAQKVRPPVEGYVLQKVVNARKLK